MLEKTLEIDDVCGTSRPESLVTFVTFAWNIRFAKAKDKIEIAFTIEAPVLNEVLMDNNCRPSPRQSNTSTILHPEISADLLAIFITN